MKIEPDSEATEVQYHAETEIFSDHKYSGSEARAVCYLIYATVPAVLRWPEGETDNSHLVLSCIIREALSLRPYTLPWLDV